jgi:hypothetical protein
MASTPSPADVDDREEVDEEVRRWLEEPDDDAPPSRPPHNPHLQDAFEDSPRRLGDGKRF